MELIKDKEFGGERPLFATHDLRLERITIVDGESGIKQCQNMEADDCRFFGKYPWWHVDGAVITNCYFAPGSRSAIWYTNNLRMQHCVIDGPKFFREMKNVVLEDVVINDADETFWRVDGLTIRNVKLHDGTYPFMFSNDIYVDGLESDSKYVFQYCKNVEVHNARIVTKDSFWECEILEDCTFDAQCARVFEYTTVNANIRGHIENIKNPTSGHIVADSIGSITIDENVRQPNDCVIEVRE